MSDEKALLSAREIVKWIESALDETGESLHWALPEYTDDGLVLVFESIIKHQYGEEPRDESIPFTD